jgi:hypothetical protein
MTKHCSCLDCKRSPRCADIMLMLLRTAGLTDQTHYACWRRCSFWLTISLRTPVPRVHPDDAAPVASGTAPASVTRCRGGGHRSAWMPGGSSLLRSRRRADRAVGRSSKQKLFRRSCFVAQGRSGTISAWVNPRPRPALPPNHPSMVPVARLGGADWRELNEECARAASVATRSPLDDRGPDKAALIL